jgi:AraC-like DNA-binding protein
MKVPYMDIVATYSNMPHRRLLDLRRDGLPEIPAFGRLCYARTRPDLPVHRHFGCIEIHFRDRGEQYFEMGGQTFHLQGGDLFVTQPSKPHSTGGYPMETGIMYWLNLRVPKKDKGLLGLAPKESAQILDRLTSIPWPQLRATSRVKPLFVELFRLHEDRNAFLRTVRMRQALVSLLLEVIESPARRTKAAFSAPIDALQRTICQSPERNYRIAELAHQMHLSESQFKSRFKAETGISPWQFILKARIDAAKQRLLAGDASITQIAMDLGFASSQYFATVFKRLTGMAPRVFRRAGAASHVPSTRCDDGQD